MKMSFFLAKTSLGVKYILKITFFNKIQPNYATFAFKINMLITINNLLAHLSIVLVAYLTFVTGITFSPKEYVYVS